MAGKSESASKFAEEILDRAKTCLLAKDYAHAFANYLMLLKVWPEAKHFIKEEFTISLNEWVAQLDQRGQTKDAFWCYEQALELWPDNDMVLDSMGAHLFRLGFPDEAASYLRQALHLNPGLHSARESLQSIASSVVERWHFRMLNDVSRNSGYLAAIRQAIRGGHDTVLDIGSGTGLLSMFAVRSGAKSVYACEMSKTMYDLSRDVLAANQMQDQIHMLHKKSTDLKVPEDLPNRVSLVVTETMDAGLLGEHILETLQHAWKYLLLPPANGRVIPAGATVHAQVIQCEALRKRHRLVSHSIGNLTLQDIEIVSKSVCTRGFTSAKADSECEPYTSEKLSSIPGGYMVLTPVFKAVEIDFNNPKHFNELQSTQHQSQITTTVHSSGQVDAIVTWFDLSLDDQHSLPTGPWCNSCWEQAIFPVHPCQIKENHPYQTSLNVDKGDTITISISCCNNHLSLMCCEISHNAPHTKAAGQQYKSTTETKATNRETVPQDSTVDDFPNIQSIDIKDADPNYAKPTDAKLKNSTACLKTFPKRTSKIVTIKEHEVAFLNDKKTQNVLLSALRNSKINLERCYLKESNAAKIEGETATDRADAASQISEKTASESGFKAPHVSNTSSDRQDFKFSVLDISQGLSLAGLYAAKLDNNTSLVSITQDNQDSQYALQCLGKSSGVDVESSVKFESKGDLLHPRTSASWDVVVVDVVEPTGVLRQQVLEDIAVARTYCLKPAGVVIPGEVTVFAMCVESESLLTDSKVLGDDRTMDLNIAKYMNVFKVSTQLDLTLSTLAYTQLSLPFFLFHLDFNQPSEADDAIPPYLHQSKTLTVDIVKDGTIMAIPFWFDLGMDKENHVNSMNRDTHWKQAAFLLDDSIEVKKGEKIVVKATLQNSSIWFDVKK